MSNLPREVLDHPLYNKWLNRAVDLLGKGANAGTAYPEIWIRDLNTFLTLSLQAGRSTELREALRTFFLFQQADGGIIDGYTEKVEQQAWEYAFIEVPDCPQLLGHKNDVEADQESSLIQAVRSYVEETGDLDFLTETIHGHTVIDRLEKALRFLCRERWAESYGLLWNATTIDWGDVQPEHAWGVRMDENTHRAIGIYTNAMFILALRDYQVLCKRLGRDASEWKQLEAETRCKIREHTWDNSARKFIPHLYLKDSPFPADFDESALYYHGGTAVAILADLLNKDEILHALHRMQENQQAAGAQTIGLTIWPLYDIPDSPNRVYHEPYHYQNGGDWPWFGGRMVLGLLEHGFIQEAHDSLLPIVEMIDRAGDFNEWHSIDGNPRGAFEFRGAAGVIGLAIQKLQHWAVSQRFLHAT